MRELILEIEIPHFITKVMLSKQRRATYYKKKDKNIPKKHLGKKFNKQGFMIDTFGNRIIKNSRSVGTPRYKKINGQEFYKGADSHHIRAKVVNELKKFYSETLKNVKPITQFPIQIEWEHHELIGVGNWDLDNLWIYNKCFQDALIDNNVIPEDNVMFITKAAAPEIFPVETEEERKIIFKVYLDKRDVILNNSVYQNMHNSTKEDW